MNRSLSRLARLYGVQTAYRDMRKIRRESAVEPLLAILASLGAPVRDENDLAQAIDFRRRELWERAIEPVSVAWDGKAPGIELRTVDGAQGMVEYALELESGERETHWVSLRRLPLRKSQMIGNTRYLARELPISRELPAGYHRLTVRLDGRSHSSLLISAPIKAFIPFDRPEWGVFAPAYALHSQCHPTAGTLREFQDLMDWIASLGGRVAGTLPLLASFLGDDPFDPSPYVPASRIFWNEFYVDVAGSRPAAKPRLIDYRKEMAFRRARLEKEAQAFFKRSSGPDYDAFQAMLMDQPNLNVYAEFRAVVDRRRCGWTRWPTRLQNGEILPGDYQESDKQYHLYAQWRIQRQLAELSGKAAANGQRLYLDLPLGLHPDAFDIWRDRDLFVRTAAGGAPPDLMFTTGQNWRFPPMHPEKIRLRRHDYTIAYVRNHFRFARLLRIDHVMGLHRLFWIPDGFSGAQGMYVEYPAEEIYAILSLESHRHQAGVVGENLGVVPPVVNSSMSRHHIQRMYVMQYEIVGADVARALRPAPSHAVASLNTHDMPPFRAFLDGDDIKDRLDLKFLKPGEARSEEANRRKNRKALTAFLQRKGFLNSETKSLPQDVFRAALKFLGQSKAGVVLLNLEDLWQETKPQNTPATDRERPNWRRLAKQSIERIVSDRKNVEILTEVDRSRRKRR